MQSSDDKQITGTFVPHVEIGVSLNIWGTPNDVDKRCWTGYLSVPQTKRLAVRVEKVLFTDGSVWSNPLYGTSTPGADRPQPARMLAPVAPMPTLAPRY